MAGAGPSLRVRRAVAIASIAVLAAGCGSSAASPGAPTGVAQATAAPTAVPTAPAVEATVAPSVACAPTLPGLVGWWPADGTAEDLAGANDGHIEGGVAFEPGKIGQAFSFNGVDSVVRVPNDPSLNPEGSFTFTAWIRPGEFADEVGLIEKWGDAEDWSANRAYDLALFADGRIRFGLADGQQQSNGSFHVFDSPAGVAPAGAWTNVAWVYDQPTGTRMVYANGTLTGQRSDRPRLPFASKADLSFGAIARSSGLVQFFYAGLIDDIRYYDRAITADEVAGEFAQAALPACG